MSLTNTYSDQQIIDSIRSGGQEFESMSTFLFKEFYGFIYKIKDKLKLNQTDAEDAYADALVKLIRQIKNGNFRGESKLSSYFYKIFYHTAVDLIRKESTNKIKNTLELNDYIGIEQDVLQILDHKEEARHVIYVINKMGETCKRILMDWGYYGYNMEEIADRANLSNAKSAASMKYKCLQKLRAILSEEKNANGK